MVSKNQKKLIKSLYQKKYRKQHGLFVAEGLKVIKELHNANFKCHALFTTDSELFEKEKKNIHKVSESELKSISFLKTAQTALAIFHIPGPEIYDFDDQLTLALDDVRDPGNLGTIIRLCDWFGIEHLICSENTVDCYNPKVIQATMGSIARVHIRYENLTNFLEEQSLRKPVFGTFMDGKSIYSEKLPSSGIVVMGNEANGISSSIERLISKKLTIPQFGYNKAESLNVATATAIVLSEFCRKKAIAIEK